MSDPGAAGVAGRRDVVVFGGRAITTAGSVARSSIASVVKALESGVARALVLDARSELDLFRSQELLRALYDDPCTPMAPLHPRRVVAVIASGDVEAAFALGRYGIGGVVEEDALSELDARVARIPQLRRGERDHATPILAPPRSARLGARAPGDAPTVTVGYRHAAETLDALARYVRVLRAHGHESSVFADVATLLEVMVADDLTCQTDLAAKAGVTHAGQFIGSFEFYRELRRTRYARIPAPPRGEIAMDVFIAVDEIVHEVLHLLFLANELRAGIEPESTMLAEELNLTWWQAAVHRRVFPDWLADRAILEINDDFLLSAENAATRGFWEVGTVFRRYAGHPWVHQVIARLPARASYVGERPDLEALIASYASRPEAAFLLEAGRARLAIPVPFASYPSQGGSRVEDGEPPKDRLAGVVC